LHVQGCLILSQVGLLFPVNHVPKKMACLTGFAPVISCMRGRHVVWLHHRDRNGEGRRLCTSDLYFDRARSLPADRIQLGQMVEHLGIAPSIPVWKVLADGHQRVSLNTYARKMESRADRCLGCSANGTLGGM
jgi:hypothetical protein